MFDKFVADLLTTYLGEYFDNIDREQVKVSVWNGRVHLRDLKVRRDALRFFDVPVCIIMGTIEELTVVIPWTHLRSESVVVEIRNARLILADKATAHYDIDQEKREERMRKDRELVGADEALMQAFKESLRAPAEASAASAPDAAADTNDNNFTARLKASILNNIRVEVKQLYVTYTSSVSADIAAGSRDEGEDGLLPKMSANAASSSAPAASPPSAASSKKETQAFMSFQITEMKTCGCNERFEPAFVDLGARMSRQLIALRGMAVSVSTNLTGASAVPLLHPLNVAVELAYQPVVTDPSTPQYMIAVHMDDPCACVLTSDTCTMCYDLLRQLRHVRAQQALRRLRPVGERPTAAPQLWWRYVLDAAKQQVRVNKSASLASAHKPTPFSWLTYTSTKAKRDRYVVLYMRRQRVPLAATRWLEPLTVDEHVEMVRLEEELSVEMLKLAKRLAMERVTVERGEYERLLRQKRATSAAAASPIVKAPVSETTQEASAAAAAASKGGWFSFWRTATPSTNASGVAAGGADDGVDDATRAELRELVQLMTAERWTDTQRAVIAREFGVSAEEAKAMAQAEGPPPRGDAAGQSRGSPAASRQRLRAAPAWVVFCRTASVSLELQSSEAEMRALHSSAEAASSSSSSLSRDTLARLLLGRLQGGGEWGGGSGGAVDATLPLACYWGSVEHFAISAANLIDSPQQQQQQQQSGGVRREQQIVTVGQPRQAREADARRGGANATSSQAANTAGGATAPARRQRPFSPLEACWSILSDECRRTAAWQFQWFHRSPQQLVSRASAVHRVKCRVAPMRLVVDVVPLRRLSDFFFSVMWPNASAASAATTGSSSGAAVKSPSSPSSTEAGEDFLTALHMPSPAPLTHVEQRCADDAEARLIVLRRKVERQHSVEWDVLLDSVTISLSEIPDKQGCEMVVRTLTLRNDIVHRLQRQAHLQGSDGGETPPAALGSAETDWIDYTHVEANSVCLAVFLPSSSETAAPIARCTILGETHFAIDVERSLLGRCLPEKPPYKLCVSSRDAVELTWSRASLSVLATSLSTLTDLATTVGETLLQRGATVAASAASSSPQNGDGSPNAAPTSTFHVAVLPHLTHKAYWKIADPSVAPSRAADGASCPANATDVFYKQMHPFSATRLATTSGAAAVARRRRVDVRRGVCVVYHPERLSFPAEYYALQQGCTRVRRTDSTSSDSTDSGAPTQPRVHLYVLQGGVDHSEVLTAEYDAAEKLLLDVVGLPPALLRNAVWMERAVQTWVAAKLVAVDREESGDSATEVIERVEQALKLVKQGSHLVPCRYVAFQCATDEEARQLESTLLRCCVARSIPPLSLTPAVQAHYHAAVVPAALRKQPQWAAAINFPSLQMVCTGTEPTPCCDALSAPSANAKTESGGVRRDAALSFVPFGLRYERFAERQRFELTVSETMQMRAGSDDSAVTLLKIHRRQEPTSPRSPDAGDALFLRFVGYFRPQPLPSLKRCAIYFGNTAAVKMRVGPAMLEWAEAWWDSVGLLTNRLFAEEVVVGYPWWTPSTAEPSRAPCEAAAAWCSDAEYGGNATSTLVDFTAPAFAVEVALPQTPAQQQGQQQTTLSEAATLRFDAAATRLHCHLTEALHHVRMELKEPCLQWQPLQAVGADAMQKWVSVMQDAGAERGSPTERHSELNVEWKLHKQPPMLSVSDWLCADTAGAQQQTGFRARQEMDVRLNAVRLLYWHPLLLHMIQSVEDGVLRRAATLTNREACWCHGGVLYCPPLSWPHRGAPRTAEVSWDVFHKTVALRQVVLQVPEDVSWMQRRGVTGESPSASVTPVCVIELEALTYSDRLCVRAAAASESSPSPPPAHAPTSESSACNLAGRTQCDGVDHVHTLEFVGVVLRRSAASRLLSPAFAAAMPRWTFTLSLPVFQASSLWKDGAEWPKAFHLRFGGDAATSWAMSVSDTALFMDLLHANYVAGNAGSQQAAVAVGLAGSSQLREPTAHSGTSGTTPASLLKPVTETSTWSLDVESQLRVVLQWSDEQQFSNLVVELGAARAVMARSCAGELSCALDARQLRLGALQGPRGSEKDTVVVPLLTFPAASFAKNPAPPTLLQMRYGWRWLAGDAAAEGGAMQSKAKTSSDTAAASARRDLFASVDATHGLRVAVDDVGWSRLKSFAEAEPLRRSMSRFAAPTEASEPVAEWGKMVLKLQLAQLECSVPCAPTPEAVGGGLGARGDLRLSLLCSNGLLRMEKDGEAWRGLLKVGRLVRCVLQDDRDASLSGSAAVPLMLEQPVGWSRPTVSSPRGSRQTSGASSPSRAAQQTMEAPKPAQQNMLDELFGELPSPLSTTPTVPSQPAAAPTPAQPRSPERRQVSSPTDASVSPSAGIDAVACLSIEFTHGAAKSTFAVKMAPLWILTPSMAHMSVMLNGLRQQMHRLASSTTSSSDTSVARMATPSAPPPQPRRAFAFDVRLGAVSVFVLQREATVTPPDCTAAQAEDAVKHALNAEALLVATEGVTAQWDSDAAAATLTASQECQTVLQLRNTSICALRGLQHCTVLLERFGVSITRQRLSRGTIGGSVADVGEEEWKLSLDPLQLTLTQFHYAALLRVVLQQTSFLAAVLSSASTASQTLAAVAVAEEEQHGIAFFNDPNAGTPFAVQPTATLPAASAVCTRFRLQLSALRLRVEEDGDSAAHAGPATAVYVQLRDFDATYFSGRGSSNSSVSMDGWNGADPSQGQSLRFAGHLHSCLVGTEGAIPTFSLVAPNAATSLTPSLLFRATQDDVIADAKRGFVHVRQVTVTVEAVPMMAWLDLLYAPYLQVAVPDYQSAKETVMERDLWLSEDLVLTERTPLRVVNKSYSLLYLYGNGHTIFLRAARRGRLMLLDEGMTLRVMHAMVRMEGESVEGYVSAGNGSYVIIDRETCTIVRPATAAAASDDSESLLPQFSTADPSKTATALHQRQQLQQRQKPTTTWTEFKGDVRIQLRVPEPRSSASSVTPHTSAHRADSAARAARTGAQRALVLYGDMRLSLVNAASALPGVNDVSGSFVLAHAGVRSDFISADGSTVNASHLVADWGMTAQYTEEKSLADGVAAGDAERGAHVSSAAPTASVQQHLRNVRLDASSGVEMRVQYSDVVFVLRAARHAQSAFARWKDALRGDLWSSLSVLPQNWEDAGTDTSRKDRAATRDARSAAETFTAVTKTELSMRIPFITFVAVDDSQSVDTPLFCLHIKELKVPTCSLEAPHTKAEVEFTLQLEYYGLAKSQWASVLDPLKVSVALNWRQNRSLLDLYSRHGFVRLVVQTGVVRSHFTLELLRNLRQLQLLRSTVEAAGVELFKSTAATDATSPPAHPSFHAFSLLQTTGVRLAAQLPVYAPSSGKGSNGDNAALASSTAHVVASGESWPFNLPRLQGRELPRQQQKIVVQLPGASGGGSSRGGVVAVASVGVQRVPLSPSGPLQRYVVAEVSVLSQQQQGVKQVHLHSIVLLRNELSRDMVQLAINERGTYDAVGTVPSGAERYVSVEVLRRRVCLTLFGPSSSQQRLGEKISALRPESVVSLGVSYDTLPCLINTTLLCTADAVDAEQSSARQPTRLAKGKLFDIYRGAATKSYFQLRVQAAPSQPPDVSRLAALAPLRSVTVVAEAAVTIHNAVGLPLSLMLLTRRVRPGVRTGLLDTSPDTTVYTAVATTTLEPNARYGATEMDPHDDICVSVALTQPNGGTLLQWSSQGSAGGGVDGGSATAYYAPACVYCVNEQRGRRDGELVLADPATGASLVLYIKYTKRVVTLYCPHWIVNETRFALQLADTSSPHAGDADRCANPVAGLSGRTVRTATVAPWEEAPEAQGTAAEAVVSVSTHVHLYNSLRAESCAKNKNNTGANGLFVRVWEPATPSSGDAPGFSDWSHQPLAVHEVAEVQVITCASRRTRGAVVVLSCRVELGSQTSLHAYSDTRVIYIRPRWVVVNKSPYTLSFSQVISANSRQTGGDAPWMCVKPFAEEVVPPVAVTNTSQGGRLHPLLSFCVQDDAQHNIRQCRWSASLPVNVVHEESTNLVFHTLIPLSQYWPQSSATGGSRGGKGGTSSVPDSLPPLKPEDITDINGDLFVDREETKVFSTTAYVYKGCMMCVEVAEAAQPPIVVENRTSFTICFQQRGVRRVATVFPRCRKAWTWDAPPSGPNTPAIVELWLAREQEPAGGTKATTGGRSASVGAAPASCVLNFDPQLIGKQSRNGNGFQQELEVEDPVRGTSTMLFVRVRGVHGMSYAVSITTEPTIDAYRTLPFPQISFALHTESVVVQLCGENAQQVLLCGVTPLSFTFAQGIRRRREGANASVDAESGDTDVQCLQLRFKSFQVDDARPLAKERVVAQLVDDRESGFQIERKLLRTTPILCCSTVAFRLTPIELHVEDGFITAMMDYQELVSGTWGLTWSTSATAKRLGAGASAQPPWKADLHTSLAQAWHIYHEADGAGGSGLARHGVGTHHTSAPLTSRVVSIDQLYVDPILVSLSLYRSPGAADDPLWKLAGAASLFVGSTQDARLQWDAVQRRNVSDTIWHLLFLHRDAYQEQMRNQYMSLVNVMGLGTVRNFVSDLFNAYGDEPRDRGGSGGSGGRGAVRRQKPRAPLRRLNSADKQAAPLGSGGGTTATSRGGASPSPDDSEEDAAAMSTTVQWVLQVRDRSLAISAQRTVTVVEVARSHPWSDFVSVANAAELRAFGGVALARAIAELPTMPRLSQRGGGGSDGSLARRTETAGAVKTGLGAARVRCTRCVELEALRLRRLRDGAATPLPHPVHDGFLTWDEFAHHINWYEFLDMCSDEEVSAYASLVRSGAAEASHNVCVLTPN